MPRAYIIGETKGKRHVIDYNAVNEANSHEAKLAAMEYYYAKAIGAHLMRRFRNREWVVDVDIRNEMVIIGCPELSKVKGYYLPMRRDTLQVLQERAYRAAGEILERYNVSRALDVDPDSFEMLPRDFRDEVKASTADTAAVPRYKGGALNG
jgi:hypothetical protein